MRHQPRCSDEAMEWPDDEMSALDLEQAIELIDLAESSLINQPSEQEPS